MLLAGMCENIQIIFILNNELWLNTFIVNDK